MRGAAALAAAAAVASCSSFRGIGRESDAVFANPAAFAGRQVRVCGFMGVQDPSNVLARRRGGRVDYEGPGLSIDPAPGVAAAFPQPHEEPARVCLRGTIFRAGCGDVGLICSGWSFRYGIAVDEVLYAD
jgi:hypothetical protein